MTILRLLTGLQPSGTLHLGNYIGAIRPFFQMLSKAQEAFIFIADYHALNKLPEPGFIKKQCLEQAATYLAFGLDPQKVHFYRQSDLLEEFELTTLLTAICPKGWMNKMHAYKDKVAKNLEAGHEPDEDVTMGLYTYPILMAADILGIHATHVPVGKDQVQHIEIARDIAERVNHYSGSPILTLPEALIEDGGDDVLVGLDGRKMSKSYNNVIPLIASDEVRTKAIMGILTDSKRPDEPKDLATSTIAKLYQSFAKPSEFDDFATRFSRGGMGYGEAKKELAQVINASLRPATERYNQIIAHPEDLEKTLRAGAERVRPLFADTLSNLKKALW